MWYQHTEGKKRRLNIDGTRQGLVAVDFRLNCGHICLLMTLKHTNHVPPPTHIQQTHRENLVSVLSSKTRFKFSVYCVLVGTFLYIHRTSVCSSKNGSNKTYSRWNKALLISIRDPSSEGRLKMTANHWDNIAHLEAASSKWCNFSFQWGYWFPLRRLSAG